MADFKTHLAGGIVAGLGMSAVGFFSADLTVTQTFSVFVMGAMGGILPDLDSDSGKPLALLFGTLSVLLPALLLNRIKSGSTNTGNLTPEFLVSYFFCSYVVINYIVCGIIKKLTSHRGIMHSIPFALLCGVMGYLLFRPSGGDFASFIGVAVTIGCVVHLVLDELNSFSLKFGFIPYLKNSSGTALKLKSSSAVTNIFVYSLLFATCIIAVFLNP